MDSSLSRGMNSSLDIGMESSLSSGVERRMRLWVFKSEGKARE
jgi:hypothetical protein